MNNIKSGTYTMPGGSTSTLAIATGLVLVPSQTTDCATASASFVVADVYAMSVVAESLLQSPSGDTLTRGQALALGQIQTATGPLNIAAVVGTGTGASTTLLVIVDMTNPASPKVLSSAALGATPTDVVLNGNTAIVGYANDTSELWDVSNPGSPQSLGLIQNVGGRLFVYNENLLFSSGAVAGVPASPLGGVHVAALNNPPISISAVNFTGNCTPLGSPGAGAGCIDIYNDVIGGADLITNPVWTPSTTYPVAYVQGQTISLNVTMTQNPVPTIPVSNVTITGHAAGLGDCVATRDLPTTATFSFSCTMNAPLPANQTKFYNPLAIDWSYSTGITASYIDTTKNQVYVTLAPPLQYQNSAQSKVYRTTLNLAVSTDGATDQASAFQKTWSQFSINGTGPANVHTWDSPPRPLYYYRNDSHPVGFHSVACGFGPLDEGILLESGNSSGQCTTFAVLFMEALGVNGIQAHEIRITAIDASDGTGFLVKDWTFSQSPSFPSEPFFKWKLVANPTARQNGDLMVPGQPASVYGDLTSKNTLPGQNTSPPSEKAFGSHFIVMAVNPLLGSPVVDPSANQYFDPSYGVTYKGEADFEIQAVDGYWTQYPTDASNVFHVRQKSPNSSNISFCDLNGPQGPTACFQ